MPKFARAISSHFSFLAAVVMLARRRVGTPPHLQVVLRSSTQRILWASSHAALLAALAALLEENSVAWDFWVLQRHSCFALAAAEMAVFRIFVASAAAPTALL